MNKLKIGILKETKNPPDRRVAVAPEQGVELIKKFPNVELFFQSSENRCFTNEEYTELGLNIVDDVSDCDILIGVKEVEISKLLEDKTYLFFSHTAKKQPYNQPLLKEILAKKIQIVDHEYLTNENGVRLVAFGFWAGLVGAYNGLLAYGKKHNSYDLKPAYECHDMDEMIQELSKVKLDPIKILITGGGRVAHGAMETLSHIDIKKVTAQQFLTRNHEHLVFAQIDPWDYVERKDDDHFDLDHFFKHPEDYKSTFKPYTKATDLFIACHFWDQNSPVFMTKKDMAEADFKIDVIADVSCDIDGPIPSTVRPSTIAEPLYGYNLKTQKETTAFDKDAVTVMAVDNLPGELPRNASVDFGTDLIEKVFSSLFGTDNTGIIKRASITTKEGKLSETFSYLQDFVDEL